MRTTLCLAFAIAVHLGCSIGFLRALPLYNWPDEPAHLNYIRGLAHGEGFAVMSPDSWYAAEIDDLKRQHFRAADASPAIALVGYEAHQPPLYYLAGAVIYRLTGSPTTVKLLNLALSCLGLILAWAIARRVDPRDERIALAAVTLLALVPTRCFMAVSIGNDVLAEVCFATFVLAVVSNARAALVGSIIGIGLLTKATLVVTLPLYAAWLILTRERTPRRARFDRLVTACVVAVAIASPWIVRNVVTYGWWDPAAIWSGALARPQSGASLIQLTASGPSGLVAFVWTVFVSWWGVFGWMEMFPGREVIAIYLALSIVPTVGCVRRLLLRTPGVVAQWLAAAPVTVLAMLAVYSLSDFQPQGRYLMIASASLALAWAAGARVIFGRFFRLWIATGGLALLWVNFHSFAHIIPWYLAR